MEKSGFSWEMEKTGVGNAKLNLRNIGKPIFDPSWERLVSKFLQIISWIFKVYSTWQGVIYKASEFLLDCNNFEKVRIVFSKNSLKPWKQCGNTFSTF